MKNTFILLTLALFFSLNITGCSLFSSGSDEKETATVSEDQASATEGGEFASDDFESGDDQDAEFDSEEIAKDDNAFDSTNEMASQDVEVEDSFGEDNYPDDDYATGGAASSPVTTAEYSDDFVDDNSFGTSESETLSVDEGGSLPDTAMSANQEEDLFGQENEPVVDTPVFSDAFSGVMDSEPVTDTPQYVSVKKMKPAAYKSGGANINRLYVARSSDTMESISQKIYGSDRSSELYSHNSHFQGKSLKVGDKVYYESPLNQNDQTMMTYYEDNSVSPQYYTSQDGDDLRKISKQLLGHDRSWMEVYATNENVDSKNRLPAGLQIRYWPEDGAPAPMPVAAKPKFQNPPPIQEEENIAMNEPEPMDINQPEEVKMDEVQEVAHIDEATPNDASMNEGNEDFSPPPTAGAVTEPPRPVAPPPPPPRANFNKPEMPAVADGQMPLSGLGEDSSIMAALGGLLILAFVIMLIFIRRSRAKRVNFSQTQV